MIKEKYIIYLKSRKIWRFTKVTNGIAFRRHFRKLEEAIYCRDNYLRNKDTSIRFKSIEEQRKEIKENIEMGISGEDGRPLTKSIAFEIDEVDVDGNKQVWYYYFDTGEESKIPDYILKNRVYKKFGRKIKT